jgi:hypothetical protein
MGWEVCNMSSRGKHGGDCQALSLLKMSDHELKVQRLAWIMWCRMRIQAETKVNSPFNTCPGLGKHFLFFLD